MWTQMVTREALIHKLQDYVRFSLNSKYSDKIEFGQKVTKVLTRLKISNPHPAPDENQNSKNYI